MPFLFLQPLTSSANNGTFSVQGTEYQKPLFIVPDIDFDLFSHYFLLVYGSPRYPSYQLYAVAKEDVSEDCLRFSPALTSNSSIFHSYYSHSEHSVTTSYDYVRVYSFNTSTGLSSFEKFNSYVAGWVFDGYSTFDSSSGTSSKYIIGSNCDIYDYAGNLLRAGDYDNLCSFFIGDLKGSSDKSQNPVPSETTTGSSGSGSGVSIDLGNIPDLLLNISNKLDVLGTLADSLNAVATSISALAISDKLDQIITHLSNILGRMFNLEQLENYLDDKFKFLTTEISEFKKAFLEFVTVGADIKKLPSLFGEIGLQFSSLINDLNDTLDGISSYFDDDNIIGNINGNIATLRSNTETIISKLDSIIDFLIDLSGKIKDCYSKLESIAYYSDWINKNIRSIDDRLFDFGEALFVSHLPVIETALSGIIDSIVDFSLDFSRFRVFFDTYAKGVIETIVDIYKLLYSLPENIGKLINADFKVEFNNFFNALNVGFAGLLASLGDIKGVIDGISAEIGDTKLSMGDIKNSLDNNFSELISLIRSESQSIRNTINSLPESFRTLLKELFIPTEDHFSDFNKIKKRFEFVNQIMKIGDALVNFAEFDNNPPVFNFDFSHELFGDFSVNLDFGVIPYKYVVFVRNFIRGVTLIVFVRRTRKRLPDVINGCGG